MAPNLIRGIRGRVILPLFPIIILALSGTPLHSQVVCPPHIQWQQSYGSAEYDSLAVVRPAQGGGYLLAGWHRNDRFANDFYVVRIDAEGNMLWEGNYGGGFSEVLTAAEESADGGWLLGGYSNSPVGNRKSSSNYGNLDYWIVRIDADGNKLSDHSYGGSGWDELHAIVPAGDGGFLLGGYSTSPPGSGNKSSASYGFNDYWVVRIDQHGRELWQQSFGAADNDYLLAMAPSADGFILAGGSASPMSPIKTAPNFGGFDIWAVHIDSNGHKLWDHTYGGDASEFARAIIPTRDGGFLLGSASSALPSGNKTAPNIGSGDFWLVRINAEGGKLWDQTYGGTSEETLYALAETSDGDFLAAGASSSGSSLNKASPDRGEGDYWVVRLNSSGQQVWEQSFGGTQFDSAYAIGEEAGGGLFVAGVSLSEATGNKTTPLIGGADFWLLKLRPETPGDCDGDGVPDERDLCPATPLNGLVDASGCTIEQSCPCERPWRSNIEYVNCVRHGTSDFVRAGLLSAEQRDALLTQAKLTNCPPPLPPPSSLIAFGFTNIALGGAILSDSSPPADDAILPASSEPSSSVAGSAVFASDLLSDGSRGMAVLLGEADSGIFFYPHAPVSWGNFDPANFMLGKAFGRMNGTDDLLLGAMQGRKTYYETYPVEIDLSPLSPQSLTIQVFLQGILQTELEVNDTATRVVFNASVNPGPRANPFWRMPDGSVGALIDLTSFVSPDEWSRMGIGLPGIEDDVVGDRVFIRANNPANHVDFVSRFEVYGGGGLPSFWMLDAQLGMFKLPHRIAGSSVFGAADGALTIQNLQSEPPDHGVIIELNRASFFDLSLAPVSLISNQYFAVYLSLDSQGIGSGGEPFPFTHNASASLEHSGSDVDLRLAGSLDGANTLVKVYKHGTLVGEVLAPFNAPGRFSVRGNGSGPRLVGFNAVAGTSNAPISITLSFDRLYTFTAANGQELRGNLIRLAPQTDAIVSSINKVGLQTSHPAFTIRDEQFVPAPPPLSIAQTEASATLRWPLQNQPFALEAAASVEGPFTAVTNEPLVLDNALSLPLPLEDATRFFRLRLNER